MLIVRKITAILYHKAYTYGRDLDLDYKGKIKTKPLENKEITQMTIEKMLLSLQVAAQKDSKTVQYAPRKYPTSKK